MKEQCMICGSVVEDVSGICPVCGAVLGRSTQENATENTYTEQIPYNYQDPIQITGIQGPKKKLLSILALVMAILALIFMCCVPWLALIFAIVSIVMGIIALVKKQIKAPAIVGLVFGGISLFVAFSMFLGNLTMKSIIGTNVVGLFQQCMDAEESGIICLEGVVLDMPGDECFALKSDGTFESVTDTDTDVLDSGTYTNLGFMDLTTEEEMNEIVVFAMTKGYEVKNVTCLRMKSTYGGVYTYCFVVPEDYQPGSTVYYIYGDSLDDYELVPISTSSY